MPALGPVIYRYTFADAAVHQTINRFAIFNIALSFSPDEAAEYEELSDSLTLLTGYLLKICPFLKALSDTPYYQALKHLAADSNRPKAAQLAKQILSLIYRRRALVYNADAFAHGKDRK